MKYTLLISILFTVLVSVNAQTPDTSQIALQTDSLAVLMAEIQQLQSTVDSLQSDTTITTKATADVIGPQSIAEMISFAKIFWSLLLIVVGGYLIRFVSYILESLAERNATSRVTIKRLVPIIKIFGWLFLVFIVVKGIIAPPKETFIAFLASLGVAVGFASQDVLKNIFGGIILLLDRPFNVGDKIQVGAVYGEVIEIGLRSTRIVTADDSLVSFPNGELMNSSVSNANVGEANCLVVAEIYLPVTINTEEIREIAMESARVSKYIYLNKPISVLFFNEVKETGWYYKMRLKAYVSDIRYEFAFKSEMTETVMRELIKQGKVKPEELVQGA